jgi:hypothetical protein
MKNEAVEAHRRELQKRWYDKRRAVEAMAAHWEREHEAQLKAMHPKAASDLKALLLAKARVAVDRGQGRIVVQPGELDAMMRALVSGLRRLRHGPPPEDGKRYQAQLEAICDELGWSWVEPPAGKLALRDAVGRDAPASDAGGRERE